MFAKRTWMTMITKEEQAEHDEGGEGDLPGHGYISIDFKIMRTNKSCQHCFSCCCCCCSLKCPRETDESWTWSPAIGDFLRHVDSLFRFSIKFVDRASLGARGNKGHWVVYVI